MELTDKEKNMVIDALKKQIEDHEVLLIDMGDNEFIRKRAHTRVMELEELVDKVENDVRTV